MQKLLPKKELNNFLISLIRKYELIAPVKNSFGKPSRFKIIKNKEEIQEIDLNGLTEISQKKFFIPERETLLEFKNGKSIENNPLIDKKKIKKRIIFGIRKCDINSLQILDNVMKDPLYISKRKNTFLIGLHCENPDEFCFCNSMELNDKGSDLFFYPDKNNYYISVNSKFGEKIVKILKEVKSGKEVVKKIKNFKVLGNKNIDKNYRNKIWQSDSDKCLSCAACTIDCPTCNCFDIYDELDINLKDGMRKRKSASCMLKSFSKVAGGKSFRDSRLSRFKHFVYHKIVYYKKVHGRYMCTGCGRCLRICPTHIDWTDTINFLNEIKDANKKKIK